MTSKNTAVFGIYKSAEHAERAVNTLIGAGYANSIFLCFYPTLAARENLLMKRTPKRPRARLPA